MSQLCRSDRDTRLGSAVRKRQSPKAHDKQCTGTRTSATFLRPFATRTCPLANRCAMRTTLNHATAAVRLPRAGFARFVPSPIWAHMAAARGAQVLSNGASSPNKIIKRIGCGAVPYQALHTQWPPPHTASTCNSAHDRARTSQRRANAPGTPDQLSNRVCAFG